MNPAPPVLFWLALGPLLLCSCAIPPAVSTSTWEFNGTEYDDYSSYADARQVAHLTEILSPHTDPEVIRNLNNRSLGLYAHFYIINPTPGMPELSEETAAALRETFDARGIAPVWLTDPTLAIGQPDLAMYAIYGEPYGRRRTVHGSAESIQYIYRRFNSDTSRFYIYTQNGTVTAWQD